MSATKGHCDPQFKEVQTLLEDFLAAGTELGAAITVNVHGKNVVDIWGGHKDEAKQEAWQEDTIVNVWSTSKTISSLATLVCIDRGLFDVDTKVSAVWPEFAAAGKDQVEVRMIMSHTSGLAGWEEQVTAADVYDREKSTALLAAQAPWWEPGTASGYHSMTMGHLLGEVIRRRTGKSLTQFVADEIAAPLGADFQLGCAEHDWPRVANVVPPPPLPIDFASLPPDSLTRKTLTNPPMDATVANSPAWRRAELGAANGHTNSRALTKIFSALALGGEVDGVRLLRPATIDKIFVQQASGVDLVIGLPLRFGTGFGLNGPGTDVASFLPPGDKIFFWGGWGGSFVVVDPERGLTFSYVMNKMGGGTLGNDCTRAYVKAVYRALGLAPAES